MLRVLCLIRGSCVMILAFIRGKVGMIGARAHATSTDLKGNVCRLLKSERRLSKEEGYHADDVTGCVVVSRSVMERLCNDVLV